MNVVSLQSDVGLKRAVRVIVQKCFRKSKFYKDSSKEETKKNGWDATAKASLQSNCKEARSKLISTKKPQAY